MTLPGFVVFINNQANFQQCSLLYFVSLYSNAGGFWGNCLFLLLHLSMTSFQFPDEIISNKKSADISSCKALSAHIPQCLVL